MDKTTKRSLFGLLARLDWIKILRNAIDSRSSSWSQKPVVEWRNAGDTLFSAVISELERKKIDTFESKVKIAYKNEGKRENVKA